MKKVSMIVAGLGLALGAHAQVLYNNLSGAQTYGDWDIDGGSATLGSSYGEQAGEVITDSNGDTSITKVETNYWGLTSRSADSGVLVQVYNFANGSAGTLVGQQNVAVTEISDTYIATGSFGGGYDWDIAANVEITGLVGGSEYLVVEQLQGPNAGIAFQSAGNADTYLRDYSSRGFGGGLVGSTSWAEASTVGGHSGDLDTEITGGAPAPEPASLCALGLGLTALARRKTRKSA